MRMEQNTKWCPFCSLLRHACCHVYSARWNGRCVDRRTAVVYSYTPIKPHRVSQANWFSLMLILTHQQQTAFQKIEGKEEWFLLFPQFFPPNQKIVSPFVNIFDIISFFAAGKKHLYNINLSYTKQIGTKALSLQSSSSKPLLAWENSQSNSVDKRSDIMFCAVWSWP